MASSKPEFIIVPGAWHGPESFEPTTTLLQKAGYTVHGINLPSVGASPHLKSFDPDGAYSKRFYFIFNCLLLKTILPLPQPVSLHNFSVKYD
jgi:hypothetical protein